MIATPNIGTPALRRWVWVAARVLGALSLLAVGADRRPLFGFMEPGYNATAIRAAQASEIATIALLGVYLVVRHVPIGSPHRRPGITSASPQEVRT
jgi:hypothetical protein